MRRVDALDIVRGIRFGEAQTLRFGESARVTLALEHRRKDEIRRPIEDAADLEDLFTGQ